MIDSTQIANNAAQAAFEQNQNLNMSVQQIAATIAAVLSTNGMSTMDGAEARAVMNAAVMAFQNTPSGAIDTMSINIAAQSAENKIEAEEQVQQQKDREAQKQEKEKEEEEKRAMSQATAVEAERNLQMRYEAPTITSAGLALAVEVELTRDRFAALLTAYRAERAERETLLKEVIANPAREATREQRAEELIYNERGIEMVEKRFAEKLGENRLEAGWQQELKVENGKIEYKGQTLTAAEVDKMHQTFEQNNNLDAAITAADLRDERIIGAKMAEANRRLEVIQEQEIMVERLRGGLETYNAVENPSLAAIQPAKNNQTVLAEMEKELNEMKAAAAASGVTAAAEIHQEVRGFNVSKLRKVDRSEIQDRSGANLEMYKQERAEKNLGNLSPPSTPKTEDNGKNRGGEVER
ncbi:MAG: hypothetical protein JSS50_00670 [Proteobacteria bacterium]|nr:hypothetical protein [Pseudomonadota bacterium]